MLHYAMRVFTIYENVTFCHPDATVEEVNAVLEQCNCMTNIATDKKE